MQDRLKAQKLVGTLFDFVACSDLCVMILSYLEQCFICKDVVYSEDAQTFRESAGAGVGCDHFLCSPICKQKHLLPCPFQTALVIKEIQMTCAESRKCAACNQNICGVCAFRCHFCHDPHHFKCATKYELLRAGSISDFFENEVHQSYDPDDWVMNCGKHVVPRVMDSYFDGGAIDGF